MATKNSFFFAGASSQAESEAKKSLVVVDSRVENYEQLIGGVKAGTEVFILSETGGAIEQITEILGQRHNINSLHVVSHGREAAIAIGSTELNIDNLETHSHQLQQWGKSLSKSASILLYGCNIAAGKSGLKFIQKISEFTGANIAASNNLTGSAALGGDWELEITTGQINAEVAFEKKVLENYKSVLATLVSENFQNAVVLGPWIYGTSGASAPPGLTAGVANPNSIIPNLGGGAPGTGALRLTAATGNQAAFVIYNSPISSVDGLRVTFDLFAYGGNGADGVSFFLINGTATPTKAGGYGGSLGYAVNNTAPATPGLVGGYLGVGLDEFGNFSNPTEGRIGGPGQRPDSITIRGNAATNYNFLTTRQVASGIDVPGGSTTRAQAKKRVQITLLPGSSRLSVAFDTNGDNVFAPAETFIDIPSLAAVNGAIPPTFKFGFASSTGGSTNIHEVANLLVETINPPASQADISVLKTGPAFVAPGGNITYTITTNNAGADTASDVLIQDQLPANLTFVSALDPNGNGVYNSITRTVIWPTVPALASGASEVRTITVNATGALGTTITNTAFSNSSTYDPTPANNNGTAVTSQVLTTVAQADVSTTKIGPVAETVGNIVTYTISTVNNGPSIATNVTVTDTIIPNLTGVVAPGGIYDSVTGIVTFPPVNLGIGVTVPNTVSFIAPAGVSVSNKASSSSATPDPTPTNNDGSAPGANVTTTLTAANQPPVANPTTGSVLPGNTLPVPGLGGNDPDGSIASYTINTLPPAAQGILFLGDPANGGVAVTPGQVLTPAQIGQLFFQSTGTFTGANFTYSATDNQGLASTAPATATLTAANQPPVANPTTGSVLPGNTLPVPGLGGNDPDGSIASYTINTIPPAAQGILFLGDPANGGVAVTPGQVLTPAQIGQLFFQSTGTFTGANFTYSATDNQGLASTAPATATLTAANQPPVANPTTGSVLPGNTLPVPGLGGNDPDGSIASYTINTLPPAAQGILFLGDPANGGVAVTPGQVLTPAQIGQLFFQSTGSFTGANFTYSATDNSGAVSPPANANLGLTGTTPNQPPEAKPTNLTVRPNSSGPVAGLGGNDPDGSIASYTINTLPPAAQGILFLGDPANGGVAVTPGQVLTPAQIGQLFFQSTGSFTGANFTYSATDNSGAVSPPANASLGLTGTTPNQAPEATPTNLTVSPNSSVPVAGLGGNDPDGSIASYTINTLPPAAQGILFLGDPANGGVAVTPGQVLTPAQIGQLFFQST
ncbi:DUF4347 domain-containing protein, partial [Tychonema sp. LEGE 06208]|uniref:DUF4347 domain-containing protein n=1 Tax=Tychonema sp. LEGE 06208 TaxID=1828663 RepID=UPI0018808A21